MGNIQVLSFDVANLIAAGEVVDRPASVIKELAENAMDAGATRITIEIQHGGIALMRVSDNGCGMSPEDLPMAIKRHATSKIRNASDLEQILTLGFRGEALAAIAAVSHLRIISKTPDALLGAVLEVHGGEIDSLNEQGCSTGTTVLVENLFYNVPARRKFLRRDATEAMTVGAVVENLALSRPDIAIRYICDGEVKLETAGDGQLKSAVWAVLGRETAQKMLEVSFEGDGVKVEGFVGRTDNVRGNRNGEHFFINRRFVRSKAAAAALEQAFTSYCPPERFPVCVLNIGIAPGRVDVNVHPSKMEVKFSNEKPVFEAVYYGVRDALENNTTRPEMLLGKTPGKIAPKASAAFAPVRDASDTSVRKRQITLSTPGATGVFEQMSAEEFRQKYGSSSGKSTGKTYLEKSVPRPAEPMDKRIEPVTEPKKTEVQKAAETVFESKETGTPEKTPAAPAGNPVKEPAPAEDYRIIGEAFKTYLLVEKGEKLLLIDKHAAHERILFEKLNAARKSAAPVSQVLLLPLELDASTEDIETLNAFREEIESIGFVFSTGRHKIYVEAVPENTETSAVMPMLECMAGQLREDAGTAARSRDAQFEKALYQAACKAAIKGGRDYEEEHTEWIVRQLMQLPDITFCPHGRPVAIELKHAYLDTQFRRS